jgi:hypothetical protein
MSRSKWQGHERGRCGQPAFDSRKQQDYQARVEQGVMLDKGGKAQGSTKSLMCLLVMRNFNENLTVLGHDIFGVMTMNEFILEAYSQISFKPKFREGTGFTGDMIPRLLAAFLKCQPSLIRGQLKEFRFVNMNRLLVLPKTVGAMTDAQLMAQGENYVPRGLEMSEIAAAVKNVAILISLVYGESMGEAFFSAAYFFIEENERTNRLETVDLEHLIWDRLINLESEARRRLSKVQSCMRDLGLTIAALSRSAAIAMADVARQIPEFEQSLEEKVFGVDACGEALSEVEQLLDARLRAQISKQYSMNLSQPLEAASDEEAVSTRRCMY